jgi:hypothetical protein
MYSNHLAVFSSGTYKEPYSTKNSLEDYKDELEKLVLDIKNNGYDAEKSVVPINKSFDIIDGSHRVATCMVLEKKITAIELPIVESNYSYGFFQSRGMIPAHLDQALLNFIKRRKNIRVGIIWPITHKSKNRSASLNKLYSELDIIVIKKLNLAYESIKLLVMQTYYEQEFLGNFNNSFKGVDRKSSEVYLINELTEVFFFRSTSNLSDKKIKDEFRQENKMKHNAIHISDNEDDTIELAKFILNDYSFKNIKNNLFVFNKNIFTRLAVFQSFLKDNNIDKNNIILTGSIVMELFGLRPSKDIDFIYSGEKNNLIHKMSHNDYFSYSLDYIDKLFSDDTKYFEFWGFKIITIETLRSNKLSRAEIKDREDIKLIDKFLSGSDVSGTLKFNKSYFMFRLFLYRLRDRTVIMTLLILKYLKLYGIVKKVYFKINKMT